MPAYQLQIKQVVDYPRCRIYRQFIHRLIDDRSIRASGGSGLFHYTVLCSFANFRTSYRRIDGISYTVYPGEWVCTLKELSQWFRTRFQCQALSILGELQQRHLIDFSSLGRGNVIRYKIRNWARHNTVLEYKVIGRAPKGNRKSNEVYWRCLCRNCGRIVHISSYQLRHSNPYGHCNCTRFHVAAESISKRKDEHHD